MYTTMKLKSVREWRKIVMKAAIGGNAAYKSSVIYNSAKC